MPKIMVILGYIIYFWSNENNEPIHFHIHKGRPTGNATKVWINFDGRTHLEHNRSQVPDKDLNNIIEIVGANKDMVISKWVDHFGNVKYNTKYFG